MVYRCAGVREATGSFSNTDDKGLSSPSKQLLSALAACADDYSSVCAAGFQSLGTLHTEYLTPR